jgi:hypothetical protein
MLSGSFRRKGKVRRRDISSRGTVHQFTVQRAGLGPLPTLPEDHGQAAERARVAPRHPCGGLERGNRLFESSSRSQRNTERPARDKRLRVLLNGPARRVDRLVQATGRAETTCEEHHDVRR